MTPSLNRKNSQDKQNLKKKGIKLMKPIFIIGAYAEIV